MKKRFTTALVVLSLLSGGCANVSLGDRFTAVDATRDDKALLYVYRPYAAPSAAYGVLVSVDEIEKAALPVDSYTRIYLSPGSHKLRFGWPLASLQKGMEGDMKFEAGNIYFVRYSAITSYAQSRAGQPVKVWSYSAQLVPAETAIAELKGCSFSRPTDDNP